MENTLYYGDNLTVLREYIPDESVDLVYLDPPFNSNATYNVLFREKTGEDSPAQIQAFNDTWDWTQEAQRTFEQEIIQHPATPLAVKDMISAFRQFIGQNAMMAYLVMMTPRLVELRRVLKPTGSLYLHCDPTAGHYLKLLLDTVLGKENFKNEIIWKRTNAHSDTAQGATHFGRIHDLLLRYAKGTKVTWNTQYTDYEPAYAENFYRHVEKSTGRRFQAVDLTARKPGGDTLYEWHGVTPYQGRYWAYSKTKMEEFEREGRLYYTKSGVPRLKYYLDEMPGVPLQDIWIDIPHALGKQRLGYDTQKPQALLERIIRASSNESDVVLDPFCGCGTAVAAAQGLNRKWIGIDITHLAVALMKNRLKTAYNLEPSKDYTVVGEPADDGSARALAEQDRFQFQFWALSLLEAFPREEGKKGPDGGIDGVISFIDGPKRTQHKAVVQVKSGHVSAPQIVQLKGVVERENAAMGLFITLDSPTSVMQKEAIGAGYFHSDIWQKDYPKVQIRTVAQLLEGNEFDLPPQAGSMYQPAQRVRRKQGYQPTLGEKPE